MSDTVKRSTSETFERLLFGDNSMGGTMRALAAIVIFALLGGTLVWALAG